MVDKKIKVKKPNEILPYNKTIPTIKEINLQKFLDTYFTIKISPESYKNFIKE